MLNDRVPDQDRLSKTPEGAAWASIPAPSRTVRPGTMRLAAAAALGLVGWLSLATLLPAQDAAPAELVKRGLYFVSPSDGVELWIPGNVNRSAHPREGMAGEFGFIVGRDVLQMYVLISAQSLTEFLAARQQKIDSTFPQAKNTVMESVKGCANPTAATIHSAIDDVPGYANKDLVVAATRVGGQKTVCFHIVCATGRGKAILPVIRSMASTARLSGEAGLPGRTGPRRIDPEHGLSYRWPLRFTRETAKSPAWLQARDETTGEILRVLPSTPEEAAAIQKAAADRKSPRDRLLRFPYPESARTVLLFHPAASSGEPARAEALIALPDGPTLSVQVEGRPERRDALMTALEWTVSGLRRLDMEQARARATEAAAALDEAIRGDDAARVRTLMDALTVGAFVPAARQALERALPRLSAAEQLRAVEALASTEEPGVAPALVNLYRTSRTRKRLQVRETILRALRHVREPAGLKLLLSESRARELPLEAAAVESLGYFPDQRAEIIRKLLTGFKKAEALGRSRKTGNIERGDRLGPVYRTALRRLTGQTFETAKDAQEWYRAHRHEW